MAPGLLGLSAGPGSTCPPEHAHMSGPPAHPGTRLPGPHHPLRLPSPNSGHPAEQWAPGRGLSAAFQGWRPAPGGSRRLPVAAPLRASLRVAGPAPAGPCVAGVCPSSLTATLSGKCAPAPAHPRTLHSHTCARPGTLHLRTHTPGCGGLRVSGIPGSRHPASVRPLPRSPGSFWGWCGVIGPACGAWALPRGCLLELSHKQSWKPLLQGHPCFSLMCPFWLLRDPPWLQWP